MLYKIIRAIKASMGIFEGRGEIYGILAEFEDPGALVQAASAVRKAGYRYFDVHSPFPIHGIDRALGLGNSKVGFITLGGGIAGLALATWMQWWMGAIDYPLNISGKAFFAIEPSVPIMFELTILFSAFGAVIGMFLLNGLPRPYNPLFYSKHFARATDDGYFLHIAAGDRRFDRERTAQFLEEIGGSNVEMLFDHGSVDEEGEKDESE